MDVHVSKTPDKAAGEYIAQLLKARDSTEILLLLSGGSSLAVLEYIDEIALESHVTVMMADERFSVNPEVNNFLQLMNTDFYDALVRHKVACIETVPKETAATPETFAIGIDKTLRYYLKLHERAQVIALLGIGEDGHFAGVFPKEKRDNFYKRYHTDDLYIGFTEGSNQHKERMTVTPYFIKNHVDDIILYASSQKKCDGILKELTKETAKEHLTPALIPARQPNSILFTDCELS